MYAYVKSRVKKLWSGSIIKDIDHYFNYLLEGKRGKRRNANLTEEEKIIIAISVN